MVFHEFTYGKNKEANAKYFIGYKTDKIRLLFIKFKQMTGFLNKFEKTQYMSFLIEDKKLLEKYESVWDRISNIIGKTWIQPVYDRKYLSI